jgi:hypothetical protein
MAATTIAIGVRKAIAAMGRSYMEKGQSRA